MKSIRTLFAVLLFSTASLQAETFKDYSFEQEKMLLTTDTIYVVSSFETSDMITAYSYYGEKIWEVTFYAKIMSWQVTPDNLFVLSKHRSGYKTYLTCLNRYSGGMLWERP